MCIPATMNRLEMLRTMVPHSERSNTAVFLEEVIQFIVQLKSRTAEAEASLASLRGIMQHQAPVAPRSKQTGVGAGAEASSFSRAPAGPPTLSGVEFTGVFGSAGQATASAISLSPSGRGSLNDLEPSQSRAIKAEPFSTAHQNASSLSKERLSNEIHQQQQIQQIQQQIQDQQDLHQQAMNQQHLLAMSPVLSSGGVGSVNPMIDASHPQSALLLHQQLQLQIQQQQHHEAALAELRKQQQATAAAVATQQMLWLQQQQQNSQHLMQVSNMPCLDQSLSWINKMFCNVAISSLA